MSESLNIFVSYSRRDTKWLEELRLHLKPLVRDEHVNLWDDTRIKEGARWKEEITQALKAAHVAILLVSKHFLASDFIHKEELQPLLRAAEQGGVVILPVIVGHCRFQQTKSLSAFQAVNDPKKPLASLRSSARRDEIFVQLTIRIEEAWTHRRQAQSPAEVPESEAVPPPSAEKSKEAAQPEGAEQAPSTERKRARTTSRSRAAPSPTTLPKMWKNALGMPFVLIPAGAFEMGSNKYDSEKPVHRVTISQPFYLGMNPVTQGQWEAVMGENPSYFKGEKRPVEQVSWGDVQEFIRRLNAQEDGSDGYRLPTEAEWEYACRAGTTGDYAGDLNAMGWYSGNSGGETHPVGRMAPNAWGLYDMHGNVWEWVEDWYGEYSSGAVTDPTGPKTGSARVIRGGGWYGTAESARSADRGYGAPGGRVFNLGFRLVRAVK